MKIIQQIMNHQYHIYYCVEKRILVYNMIIIHLSIFFEVTRIEMVFFEMTELILNITELPLFSLSTP